MHGQGAGGPSEAAVSGLHDRPERRHGCGGDAGQADLQSKDVKGVLDVCLTGAKVTKVHIFKLCTYTPTLQISGDL